MYSSIDRFQIVYSCVKINIENYGHTIPSLEWPNKGSGRMVTWLVGLSKIERTQYNSKVVVFLVHPCLSFYTPYVYLIDKI